MKKRTVLAMLTALTITASVFAGCGSSADAVPASNMTDKTGSALEDDESLKDNAADKKQADSEQKDTKTPPAVEKTTDEKEAEAKAETKDTAPADTTAKSNGNGSTGNTGSKPSGGNSGGSNSSKPSNGNNSSAPSGGNNSSASSGGNNSSASSGGNSGNSGSAPAAQPEAPAHEHTWHEHTATKQEWVPNVVVVDDYQTQQVVVGFYFECNCGATFQPNDSTLDEHSINHILAGEPSNTWTVDKYEEQQVKVGSHEEDHGHYETVTYVDYYYCDCGATK